MIIRWLGAFCHRGSLLDSLRWELTQTSRQVVAAEKLKKGRSLISHARVGLLVKNSALVRKYNSDVYSRYNKVGKLKKCRNEGEAFSSHTECWVKPYFVGIVVKNLNKILNKALCDIVKCHEEFRIDVYQLTRDGKLIK